MPRQPRLDAPGTLHHVMVRGIDGKKIFRTIKDREDFLIRLSCLCESEALSIYAWALMTNHAHLLVRTGRKPLSKSMRKLLTGYAVNYNRKHKRSGHLFQNRYKSIVCEDDPYLLELTRYIHLNPVAAGLVRRAEDWEFSSFLEFLGLRDGTLPRTGIVLSQFPSRDAYRLFVEVSVEQDRRAIEHLVFD